MHRPRSNFFSTTSARPLVLVLAALTASRACPSPATEKSPMEPGVIQIDAASASKPLNKMFNHCIGAGRANEGLRADWQRQLRETKGLCGFRYIRMHGLLCDDMGVYHEVNGKPVYNWQYIDELFDFLVELEVRPLVEFGFMPGALASGDKIIFWWKGNVTPPKDYAKWADLISALVRHWTERYGRKEVTKWYFEVWNEPNLDGFWAADQKEYFKLYTTTAQAVKSVNSSYRVGGPATAGNAWVPEFIEYCVKTKSPVDFVSTHTYGVDVGYLDEFGGRGTVLSRNPDSVIGDTRTANQQIKSSALPHLPLFYTEWSSSYTPADPVHDSYISCAFVLDKLTKSSSFADSMSYWTFTDIFEEAGPRTTPFHGGFGLINYQGIKKPAFRAFEFLNRLGDQQLDCETPQTLVAKTGDGIQILTWDYTNPIPGDTNNQAFFIQDIKPKSKGEVRIKVAGLKPGSYRVSVYRVGYRQNDPYADYFDLGRPSQLTKPQVEKIKARNSGEPVTVETVELKKGQTLERVYPMRENDVWLVDVMRSPSLKG